MINQEKARRRKRMKATLEKKHERLTRKKGYRHPASAKLREEMVTLQMDWAA